jgi:hypothetical protein
MRSDAAAARLARAAYLRWLELRYGRRGVPWLLNGEPIRILPNVRHLVPSAEPALFEYLRRGIRPGAVVLDVGGFLGAYPQLWPASGLTMETFAARLAALGLRARALDGGPCPVSPDAHALLKYT